MSQQAKPFVCVTYPIKFPLGFMVRHKDGGEYLILSLPEQNVKTGTREPMYGYLMKDGRVAYRSQEEMEEEGRFELLFTPVPDWAREKLENLRREFDRLYLMVGRRPAAGGLPSTTEGIDLERYG